MVVLSHNCLHCVLGLDTFPLILLTHNDRPLERVKQISDLVLNGLWQSGPFRFDRLLRNSADTLLQVGVLFACGLIVANLVIARALPLRRHGGISWAQI